MTFFVLHVCRITTTLLC